MDIFSHNGELRPADQAQASLFAVELSYGFGVYENIRVKKGQALYADEHADRLLGSAKIIELEHTLDKDSILKYIDELVAAVDEPAFNLKLLLIGGPTADDAAFYILPLRPRFPDRKEYKTGATAITIEHERYLPNAKTLNMLPSYLAYRQAQRAGAYDAILINRHGQMVEGTRTNLFAMRGKEIITPLDDEVLIGVTRTHVIKTAESNGFKVTQDTIPYDAAANYDAIFLTSTSTKIMPLRQIDEIELPISDELRELMTAFDAAW